MQKKKMLVAVLIIAVMTILTVMPGMAEIVSNVSVAVNNKILSSNVSTVNYNGTLLVPAKEFAEALGGTFSSDRAALTGTLKQGENELIFRLDNSIVKHNGKYIKAPAPMKISGYRYMVPAEFVAKTLGAEMYMHTWKNTLMAFQPADGKLVYEVKSGDTLWIISQVFSTSITTIKQLNSLSTDSLYVGQKLVIKNFAPSSTIYPAQVLKNASIKSGAGFGYSDIGYLLPVADVSIIGKNGDWYKATTPKGTGYLHYSVVSIKQDLTDTAVDSNFFDKEISVDTSKDYITYTTYTVQKGDNIWAISEKLGLPDYELAQANNLSPYAILSVGQVLKVPVHNIPVKSKLGSQFGEVLDWFEEAQYLFPIGKVGKFIDVETGKSFMAKRTMGANHSDTETITTQDTQTMKEIFGGYWNWNRRPFILEVDGRRFAISVAGMPHAGVDGLPYLQNVSNRSDDWGYGPNYDRISGNAMSGHFDVYFLNGIRHKDNLIDSAHQYRVLMAGGLQ